MLNRRFLFFFVFRFKPSFQGFFCFLPVIIIMDPEEVIACLLTGVEPDDDTLLNACGKVAVLYTAYNMQEDLPIADFVLLHNGKEYPVIRFHHFWLDAGIRFIHQMSDAARKTILEGWDKFEGICIVHVIKGMHLVVTASTCKCNVCGEQYTSHINMWRCKASHPRSSAGSKKGMKSVRKNVAGDRAWYRVGDIVDAWQACTIEERKKIASDAFAEANGVASFACAPLADLLALMDKHSEGTYLFKMAGPSPSLPEPCELISATDRGAASVARIVDALMLLRAEKAAEELAAAEIHEKLQRKAVQEKARIKKLEKMVWSTRTVVGLTGQWWEEED